MNGGNPPVAHAVYRLSSTMDGQRRIAATAFAIERQIQSLVSDGASPSTARKHACAGGFQCEHGSEMSYVKPHARKGGHAVKAHFRHVMHPTAHDGGTGDGQHTGGCGCSSVHCTAQALLQITIPVRSVIFRSFCTCKLCVSDIHTFPDAVQYAVRLEERVTLPSGRAAVLDVCVFADGCQWLAVEVKHTHATLIGDREGVKFREVEASHVIETINEEEDGAIVLRCTPVECPLVTASKVAWAASRAAFMTFRNKLSWYVTERVRDASEHASLAARYSRTLADRSESIVFRIKEHTIRVMASAKSAATAARHAEWSAAAILRGLFSGMYFVHPSTRAIVCADDVIIEDDDGDESGVSSEEIELVMCIMNKMAVSRARVVNALKANNGDIQDTVIELGMASSVDIPWFVVYIDIGGETFQAPLPPKDFLRHAAVDTQDHLRRQFVFRSVLHRVLESAEYIVDEMGLLLDKIQTIKNTRAVQYRGFVTETGNGGTVICNGSQTIAKILCSSDGVCLTDIVATEGGPAVYAEFGVLSANIGGDVSVGIGALVHKDGLDLNKNFMISNEAYFMNLYDGSLWGSGKWFSDRQDAGSVRVGDMMGVLVKAGVNGYVRFYRNSAVFGPGFTGPVKAPLVLAVQVRPPIWSCISINEGASLELHTATEVPLASNAPLEYKKQLVTTVRELLNSLNVPPKLSDEIKWVGYATGLQENIKHMENLLTRLGIPVNKVIEGNVTKKRVRAADKKRNERNATKMIADLKFHVEQILTSLPPPAFNFIWYRYVRFKNVADHYNRAIELLDIVRVAVAVAVPLVKDPPPKRRRC